MTDRVEEIRERVEEGRQHGEFGRWGEKAADYDFLLSEIQRLKKVEEAAREFHEAHWAVEQGVTSFDLHEEAVKRLHRADAALKNALASLSNTLEQPEPVIQEMER